MKRFIRKSSIVYGLAAAAVLAPLPALFSCGTGVGSPITYTSTSTKGDFATWTITGNNLHAVWKVTTTDGAVAKTFTVDATCGEPHATYGYKTCEIEEGSCSNGEEDCGDETPDGEFHMMDVPGVALFVHIEGDDQLHVGIVTDEDGCDANVSGNYTYIRAGAGNSDIFGMYHSDSSLNTVEHADFGFNTAAAATTPTVVATTGGGNGHDELVGSSCSNGVRTRTVNGDTLRSMMTESGLFIMDMPSGQGGIVSFKTSKAASLSDLANKEFGGITFNDDGTNKLIAASTGSSNGSRVVITAQVQDEGEQTLEFKPFSNTSSTAAAPAFPDFT
ncbi:MAG: hypothetical protein IT285_03375, partial [Bdellovibrionales bacterium]|nr:hypothetical protein [Bdellovibrionales bacterium]